MKICLLTTQVPFIRGGAEVLTDSLASELRNRGHRVELIQLPFASHPAPTLKACIDHARAFDLSARCDRAIGLKFPTYYNQHDRLSMWIMHQHREFYDLWDHPAIKDYRGSTGISALRDQVISLDSAELGKHKNLFTISPNVSKRLKLFNGLDSTPMYPPPSEHHLLQPGEFGDYILVPSRLGPLKRQELVLRALARTRADSKVVFLGAPDSDEYLDTLRGITRELGLEARVRWTGYVTREEKISLYAGTKGVIFIPVDEDMGYITMEAAIAEKPVITCSDSGGPLEFVEHSKNGWIMPPEADSLAMAMDEMWTSKESRLREMGKLGHEIYRAKNISWETILERLL